MDGNQFDNLARSVAGTSRRSMIKGGIGALFGGAILLAGQQETEAAKKKRKRGQTCRVTSDCELDLTCEMTADGRRRCGACQKNNCDQCVVADNCNEEVFVDCGDNSGDIEACAVAETAECGTTCIERLCTYTPCTSSSDCESGLCIRVPGCCDDDSFWCAIPCGGSIDPVSIDSASITRYR